MHVGTTFWRIAMSLVVLHLRTALQVDGSNVRQQVSYLGQNVTTLRCNTSNGADVNWQYQRSVSESQQFVYVNGSIAYAFRQRFSLNWSYKGNHDLIIRNVQPTEAGLYTCVEGHIFGTRHIIQIQLTVEVPTPPEWDPALDMDRYPNPLNEPARCKQNSSEFWLCDPNNILTSSQAQLIRDHIRHIQEGASHNILVGVALVSKLKLLSQEEVVQKTGYCGASILNATWSGFRSSCGDDCEGYVYVFLSWNDYQYFISTSFQDAQLEDCQQEFNDLPKLLNASDVSSNFVYIDATLTILGKYANGECLTEPLEPTRCDEKCVGGSVAGGLSAGCGCAVGARHLICKWKRRKNDEAKASSNESEPDQGSDEEKATGNEAAVTVTLTVDVKATSI